LQAILVVRANFGNQPDPCAISERSKTLGFTDRKRSLSLPKVDVLSGISLMQGHSINPAASYVTALDQGNLFEPNRPIIDFLKLEESQLTMIQGSLAKTTFGVFVFSKRNIDFRMFKFHYLR